MIGQRKLLQWSVPGVAHALTFWGFIVLILTIIEAYGDLFSRTFAIPGIGTWPAIGFLEDLFSVGVLAGIVTFTWSRLISRSACAAGSLGPGTAVVAAVSSVTSLLRAGPRGAASRLRATYRSPAGSVTRRAGRKAARALSR